VTAPSINFTTAEDRPHGDIRITLKLTNPSITTHITDAKGQSTQHSVFSWS
jgi:hypothetical protein